jgi:transposase
MVVQPPQSIEPAVLPEPLSLPSARGDGAYGNAPTQQRANDAGFRMRAPKRGQTRTPGIGTIRCAVERGHAWLAQFGRIVRRLDRDDRRYLGWIELAASIIFIRSGLVTATC